MTSWAASPPFLEQFVASGPFDVGGAHAYQAVTMYDDGQFPASLEKGAKEWDERESERDGRPGQGIIGSVDSGVLVDQSEQQIACIPVSLWVGGTDGTDGASVDLELADGSTVEATVASGTLVPGETVFWATVPGELVRAVTRDADGEVLEDHPLRPCSGDLDCEVR